MGRAIIDKISQETLNNCIQNSHSFFQVLSDIGYKQIYDKKNIQKVKEKCDLWNIDYSHLREDRNLEELTCTECGKLLPISEFYQYNGKVQHICLNCKKKYQNKYYSNNINELNEYKQTLKCAKCGYNKCGASLDFHHRNPEEKSFGIARRANTKLSTLMPEIEKCVVLCANCHREFHYLNNLNKNFKLEDYLEG